MNYFNTLIRTILLFAIAFGWPPLVVAQQSAEQKVYTDDELYSMDLEKLLTVEIASVAKINLENESEAAGVVTVITREQFVNTGAKNIEEVLRMVAGFDAVRPSFSPNTSFGVRGLYSTEGTNNKILFLIDGHPFRSVFFGDAGVFASNISLNNVSKIEIIRGPGSTLFGAGAFLGVVNIVTKEAEKSIEASLSGGSFGTYEFSLLGTIADPDKKFKTSISASHFATDGPDVALESDIAKEQVDPFGPPIGYTATSSAAPGNLNYARKTSQFNLHSDLGKFYFKGLFANSNDTPPVGAYDALTHDNDYRSTTAFGELGLKLAFGQETGELLVKTYYDYSNMNYHQELWSAEATQMFNAFTDASYPAFGSMLTGPALHYAAGEGLDYHIKAQHEGIGSEINVAYNFNNKVKLITGLLYETNKQYGVRTHANGNIFFEYLPEYFMQIGDRNYLSLEAFGKELEITSDYNWNRNTSRDIFAAFGQAEINLVQSLGLNNISALLLTVGGRYDHYSDAGDRFNPRAAMIFSPSDKVYFKALYGTAFRAPSFSELYTANNSIRLGNPALKPETVKTQELVAGYKAGKKAEATITYFDIQVDKNIQLRDATAGAGFGRQYANIGKIRSRGAEISLKFIANEKLSTFINFTYQHVEDVTKDSVSAVLASSGERATFRQKDFHPGGTPLYIANAGFNYAISKNINFNMSANYAGERLRTDKKTFEAIPGSFESTGDIIDIDTRKNIEARVLLNASVRFHSFDFAKGLELQLSGYNLTDSKNYNEANGILADDLRREGVNWLARVSYRF